MKDVPRKIPKELPIMGKSHNLIIINDPLNKDSGWFLNSDIVINMAWNNSDEFWHTLVHELGHALIRRSGLRQGLSMEMEEVIVQNYATVFTELFKMTFKNNKDIGIPL